MPHPESPPSESVNQGHPDSPTHRPTDPLRQERARLESTLSPLRAKAEAWQAWNEGGQQGTEPPKPTIAEYREITRLAHSLLDIRQGRMPLVEHTAAERQRHGAPLTATVHPDVVSFESGREITLDPREVLESSLAFLTEKAPPTWAASLHDAFPSGLTFTPDQRATIERAMEHGFTRAILMPGADVQGITTIERTVPDPSDPTKMITERVLTAPDTLRAATDRLLQTCATDPVPGLTTGDPDSQYEAPYVESDSLRTPTLRTGAPLRTRPYLLLYRPDGVLPETKDKTFSECDAILTARATDWNIPTLTGFTNPEKLLIQRKEVEARTPLTPTERTAQHGDPRIHAFDAYSDSATESNWSWDLDSRVPGGCALGDWDPRDRRSKLRWRVAAIRSPGLGACPAVVVEL